jgi:hypothetical protein
MFGPPTPHGLQRLETQIALILADKRQGVIAGLIG